MGQRSVSARLRRTSRALAAHYNDAFREAGIRSTQWPLLAALRVAGGLSLSELAEAVGTDLSTIGRNIQPLVREGLVDIRLIASTCSWFAFAYASGERRSRLPDDGPFEPSTWRDRTQQRKARGKAVDRIAKLRRVRVEDLIDHPDHAIER